MDLERGLVQRAPKGCKMCDIWIPMSFSEKTWCGVDGECVFDADLFLSRYHLTVKPAL